MSETTSPKYSAGTMQPDTETKQRKYEQKSCEEREKKSGGSFWKAEAIQSAFSTSFQQFKLALIVSFLLIIHWAKKPLLI